MNIESKSSRKEREHKERKSGKSGSLQEQLSVHKKESIHCDDPCDDMYPQVSNA